MNPYAIVIGAAAFALLGAAVWIQTSRLETRTLERDVAVQTANDNKKAAEDAEAAKKLADDASAERVKQEQAARAAAETALRDYRSTVRGESNACHFAPVDPSVDRLLERPRPGGSPAD